MEENTCNSVPLNPSKECNSVFNELNHILVASFLPEQLHAFDQPLESESFKVHISQTESNFSKIISLLCGLDTLVHLPKNLIVSMVLLIGEHSKNDVWTSPQSIVLAKTLLNDLIIRFDGQEIPKFLSKFKVESFISELRPKLLKTTWKKYPAAMSCFNWLLFNIEYPELEENLNSLLPPCLLLVDDHELPNKISGLRSLQHLADHLTRADLNQYNRGTVIYNAIDHMIYLREAQVIPCLGDCLAALLPKIEHRASTDKLEWNHFDDVLNIWLPSMEMEQRLTLREAYICSVRRLLSVMGLGAARWSDKLLSVLSEYSLQDHTCDMALQTLLTFVEAAWPRVPYNFSLIAVILFKVTINITKREQPNMSTSTIKLLKQCFKALEDLDSEAYNTCMAKVRDNSSFTECYVLLTES